MNDLCQQTLRGLRDLVRRGETSRAEVARAFLERARRRHELIQGYIGLNEDLVRQAEVLDRAAGDGGEPGPLEGLPIAVKDNICTQGFPTRCASRLLDGYEPPYDATAWAAARGAGALLLGKTNLDEFAMGSSNENSTHGPTHNPWNPERVPGGSSGGSAAVVADRSAPAALGSDTGGSVRQPAAFCGVVGLKPTYGRVSRYGLVAFASSMDQIGPMARTPLDCALLLDAVAGPDPRDSTTVETDDEASFEELAERAPGRFRFALAPDADADGVDPDVRRGVEDSCQTLEQIGGERVEISLPLTDHGIAVYYVIAPAEASSNLARYDGIRYGVRVEGKDLVETYKRTRAEGFGPEVKRRIMLGTYVLSSGYHDQYYRRASRVRHRIAMDYENAFQTADIIVSPTAPTTAFRIGERSEDPLSMYMSDAFTVAANLTGIPGISVPCGLDGDGLPIGIQFLGPAFSDGTLLSLAHHFLEARPFAHAPPNLG